MQNAGGFRPGKKMLPYAFKSLFETMIDSFPQIIDFSGLSPPPLVPQQVHVMAASLEDLEPHREPATMAINAEERARAERFVNPQHGEQFTLVRGVLRLILANYLGISADRIQFDFNQYGKPEIHHSQNSLSLHFNISHSHQMAAFVFCLGQKVGIDVEYRKPLKNLAGLAQHICHPMELNEFNGLAEDQCNTAFFRLWTRKEAFIKANGQGLSMGLRSIYIGFKEADFISRVQYENNWLHNWLIKDLHCPQDYKMAVAVEIP
jgi:4'-phosphopantetheinyl transferase